MRIVLVAEEAAGVRALRLVVGSGHDLHAGPLPQYAGLSVPSWAAYHGELRHGATLHRMTAVVDADPIACATPFGITGRDTGLTASATCAQRGLGLVAQLLDALHADPDAVDAGTDSAVSIACADERIEVGDVRTGPDAAAPTEAGGGAPVARWSRVPVTATAGPPAPGRAGGRRSARCRPRSRRGRTR